MVAIWDILVKTNLFVLKFLVIFSKVYSLQDYRIIESIDILNILSGF